MIALFGIEPQIYVPGGLAVLTAFVKRRPVPEKLGRLVLLTALAFLVIGVITRFAVLFTGLFKAVISPWDASIQAVAGAWLNGQPMYPVPSDGFYGMIYGPLLYEIVGTAQRVAGIGAPMAGLPMVLAEIAAVGFTWVAMRRIGVSRAAGIAALAVMVVEFGSLRLGGVRGDQVLVLLASVALAIAPSAMERPWPAILIGVCGGLCMALKITGFVYVLPALIPLLLTPGFDRARVLAWSTTGTALGLSIPYLAAGGPVQGHVALFLDAASYQPTSTILVINLLFAISLVAPVLFWSSESISGERRRRLAGVLPLLPIILVGGWKGSGPWHFAPFLPALALVLGQLLSKSLAIDSKRILLMGMLLVVVSFDAKQLLPGLMNSTSENRYIQVREGIDRFLAGHPADTIAFGSTWSAPGREVDLGAFQAELPRAGRQLLFMEQSWIIRNTPASVMIGRLITTCRVRYWINAPGPPFGAPYYDVRLKNAMLEHYEPSGSFYGFNVWRCREDHNQPLSR